jgi:hypothetical protein
MCNAITKKGNICKNKGKPFCKIHTKQDGYFIEQSTLDTLDEALTIKIDGCKEFVIVGIEKYCDTIISLACAESEMSTMHNQALDLQDIRTIRDRERDETYMIEINRHKKLLNHTREVLEKTRTESSTKCKKITTQYQNIVSMTVDIKRKMKDLKADNYRLEQAVRTLKNTDTIRHCLRDFQTLDDFIDNEMFKYTGIRRGPYARNNIYDFITMDNIDKILQPYNTDAEAFKNKYLQIRKDRITTAHPTCSKDNKNIRRILNTISG